MVDAIKKMDKKFLFIALIIILLPIILIVFLAMIQGCDNSKMTHEKYEEKMIKAGEKYIKTKNIIPKEEGEIVKIKLDKLVKAGYIKSAEEALDDKTCDGKVFVRRNGASMDTSGSGYLNYTVVLECKDYSTATFKSKLIEKVVTSESGLYLVGDEYIFKGNKPNNFIKFFGNDYRIMGITKDGLVKLIKSEPEMSARYWDNKFNVDVNRSYGKTIYKDSAILSFLINDYRNAKIISTKAKQHVVAHDVCIGKRDYKDTKISREIDCSEILENQLISLMNASDFALASNDPDCTSTVSRSCRNYNYLFKIASSTWTPNTVKGSTYESFFISDGILEYQEASNYNEYNIVIYIDGNETGITGTGTEFDPYVFG